MKKIEFKKNRQHKKKLFNKRFTLRYTQKDVNANKKAVPSNKRTEFNFGKDEIIYWILMPTNIYSNIMNSPLKHIEMINLNNNNVNHGCLVVSSWHIFSHFATFGRCKRGVEFSPVVITSNSNLLLKCINTHSLSCLLLNLMEKLNVFEGNFVAFVIIDN